MDQEIIRIDNIKKVYKTGGGISVTALNNVEFSVYKGDFLVMTGPSGSGKTTMLNMIGALDQPTSGSVIIDKQNVTELSFGDRITLRRDKLGFIFQAYNLMPVLTVIENVEYILMLQGVSKSIRREKSRESLKQLGLVDMDNRFPNQLSGGQQQRVAIARALVSEPLIILADEPTANLDSKTTENLLNDMERLNQEQGITFLFSSHDASITSRAKRIIELKDGKIMYNGDLAGFKDDEII